MIPMPLRRAVTVSQTPVPLQVCFIVRADASADIFDAIFEDCHHRWGGKDSLIIPISPDGIIDESYWTWARAIDPDVVYSYVDLENATLERIDRELMPTIIEIHRDLGANGDSRVRYDYEIQGLPAISLLPMIATTERIGPPSRYTLVSAFQELVERSIYIR